MQVCVWQADNTRARTDSLHTSPSAQSLEATARTMSENGWPVMTDFWNSAETCRGKQWKSSTQHSLYLENPCSILCSTVIYKRHMAERKFPVWNKVHLTAQRTAFLLCLKHARFLCTQRLYAESMCFFIIFMPLVKSTFNSS